MTAVAPEKEKQKTTILNNGSNYHLFGDVGIIDKLPSKVLEIHTSMMGMYLEETTPITLPKKVYSNDKSFIKHVLKSYATVEGSLGILLSGGKGLGKSFTANVICDALRLPVIKVTSKLPQGGDLFSFLNKIQQEHIIFIDEFEKIFSVGSGYNGSSPEDATKFMQQNDFLSFLDNGSIGTKKLFIITANERVSDYLMNRPTRIRYHRRYEQMAIEVIKEIVNDLLVNQDFKQDLIENVPQKDVNIDVLIKIIQEVNLHNMPYSKFKDFFNFQTGVYETVKIVRENGTLVIDNVNLCFPLSQYQTLFYDVKTGDDIELEEVLSETPVETVVNARKLNRDWEDETSECDEYIYEVFVIKRKHNVLF